MPLGHVSSMGPWDLNSLVSFQPKESCSDERDLKQITNPATEKTIILVHYWKWQPTPVFLPGESNGQRSLVGYSRWGRKESDMTERLTHNTHYNTKQKSHMVKETVASETLICMDHFHTNERGPSNFILIIVYYISWMRLPKLYKFKAPQRL